MCVSASAEVDPSPYGCQMMNRPSAAPRRTGKAPASGLSLSIRAKTLHACTAFRKHWPKICVINFSSSSRSCFLACFMALALGQPPSQVSWPPWPGAIMACAARLRRHFKGMFSESPRTESEHWSARLPSQRGCTSAG